MSNYQDSTESNCSFYFVDLNIPIIYWSFCSGILLAEQQSKIIFQDQNQEIAAPSVVPTVFDIMTRADLCKCIFSDSEYIATSSFNYTTFSPFWVNQNDYK